MTKKDLIARISEQTGLPKSSVKAVVDSFLVTVEEALASGDKVSLPGFGTFRVTRRAERKARNPRTGELISIPAYKAPVFSAGRHLKQMANKE